MDATTGKRLMIELLALHAATKRSDEAIARAAAKIHDHHARRVEFLAPRVGGLGSRDDDLVEDYLDSLIERDIAARYLPRR